MDRSHNCRKTTKNIPDRNQIGHMEEADQQKLKNEAKKIDTKGQQNCLYGRKTTEKQVTHFLTKRDYSRKGFWTI